MMEGVMESQIYKTERQRQSDEERERDLFSCNWFIHTWKWGQNSISSQWLELKRWIELLYLCLSIFIRFHIERIITHWLSMSNTECQSLLWSNLLKPTSLQTPKDNNIPIWRDVSHAEDGNSDFLMNIQWWLICMLTFSWGYTQRTFLNHVVSLQGIHVINKVVIGQIKSCGKKKRSEMQSKK